MSDRGKPRIQYERTYVLLFPGAGAEWVQAVTDATWDRCRYTIGGSADDAGIGDLDVRRVIAVNPERWGGDLGAFFQQYYAGVQYETLTAPSPDALFELLTATEPEPSPDPSGDLFPLRGLHDREGGDWLFNEGLSGWCLEPVYLGISSQQLNLVPDPNIRFLVNLRYSWAVDDGGAGTMPGGYQLEAFEEACIETMRQNPEAWGFVYCNEFNNPREWPDGYQLTPSDYLLSYNRVWARKPTGARLLPGAIDPYNAGWGDWRTGWGEVLNLLAGADGLTFHAYTHGPDLALIRGERRFSDDPLKEVFYDLRVLESQQAIVPSRFLGLPQIVTETNHFTCWNGQIGWEPDAGAWVSAAYEYFASRGIVGACLFRFDHTDWRISDKPEILQVLKSIELCS